MRLRAWLEREQARQHAPEIPYVDPSVGKRVAAVTAITHKEREIAALTGDVDIGKTAAMRHYSAESNNTPATHGAQRSRPAAATGGCLLPAAACGDQ